MQHRSLIVFAILPLLFCGCLGHLGNRPLSYRDYGSGGQYGVAHADYYEAECATCAPPGVVAHGRCGSAHCDRCEGGTTIPIGAYRGLPLTERLKHRLACGDGCGEVYVGEWISTPPTPDPCDCDGNYTGVENGMMYHPHAQPVRTTLRRILGIRFFGTRYGGESWGDADAEFFDESHLEASHYAPANSPGFHSPPSAVKPSCNCGH